MGLKIRDKRTEQRFFIDNCIIDNYGAELGVYGIAVYNTLVRFSDPNTGRDSWPSYKTVADRIGCSSRKVQQVVKQLVKLKLVASVPRYSNDGRQTSNEYIILDPPERHAPPPSTTDTPTPVSDVPTTNPPSDQSSGKEEARKESRQPAPAIEAFRKATNRNPRKPLYKPIISAVGDNERDVKRWHDTCLAWIGCGYSPMNVNGMLDYYRRGEIPSTAPPNRNGNGNKPKTPDIGLEELAPGVY